jgi:pyruvate/2-oxoglutarate dehydrogenase complex dihydrolipoamide acyltransferase (E2) component
MADAGSTHVLRVPQMGFAKGGVSVAVWLVGEHAKVLEGDRVVQLVAGAATVDLLAPVTGRLERQLVDEDELVESGDGLAIFSMTAAGGADQS